MGVEPSVARAQVTPQSNALLVSRSELTAAAEREAGRNPELAATIRQRLRNGDFQTGDRIVIAYQTEALHRDTLLVRGDRVVELPWKASIPLAGVLRSEVQRLLSTEVLKFVKTDQVEVTPLMRLGVMGEVTRPGFFAFPSDMALTDVLMIGSGGLTAEADVRRSIVRRGGREFKSSEETSQAIERGLTLDQFDLTAGDELVVGQRSGSLLTPTLTLIGALVSVATLYIAFRPHPQ